VAHSLEVKHLISYLSRMGVPFRVTDVNTVGVHTTGSYHYKSGTDGLGLAIDIAELTPSSGTPGLLKLFSLFGPVESRLAELIYSGAPYNIKNGVRVPRYAVATHWNHVHVAVPKGTFLDPGVIMPDDPNLPNITGPVSFHPLIDQAGMCTGYYIFSSKTGELHSFGPGAKFYGRSEVVA
jgi:hypothetical protein